MDSSAVNYVKQVVCPAVTDSVEGFSCRLIIEYVFPAFTSGEIIWEYRRGKNEVASTFNVFVKSGQF
jgi:hypothetical protein